MLGLGLICFDDDRVQGLEFRKCTSARWLYGNLPCIGVEVMKVKWQLLFGVRKNGKENGDYKLGFRVQKEWMESGAYNVTWGGSPLLRERFTE